ncbi:MAG: AsmA family protein [Cyclobacteriaceae bacterium]|nr:AsmA family protein [Cyclobacteriaceae bacterium]
MKLFKRIFYYLTVLVLAILFGGALGIYIYKDDIIDLLKDEVNKSLKTELEVEKIDIDFFKGFPNLAVAFKGVRFHSAFSNEMLLTGDRVFFVLNIWDLLEKDIVIQRLEIDNGELILHTDKKGKHNYDVFVKSDSASTASGSLDIHSVKLSNVAVIYKDEVGALAMDFNINTLSGSAQFENKGIEFVVHSIFSINDTNTGSIKWAIGQNLILTTKVIYNDQLLSISPSELEINKAHFNFNGDVNLENSTLRIELSGKQNNFSSLVSVLPENFKKKLAPFNGKGLIDFTAGFKGTITETSWPGITATMHLKDFEINHEKLKEVLYLKDVEGNLSIKDLKKPETGKFTLEHIDARVKDKEIMINGVVHNFSNPSIQGEIAGDFDVPWMLSLTNADLTMPAEGYIHINATIKSQVLKKDNSEGLDLQNVDATFNFNDVSFSLVDFPTVSHLKGEVQWKNENTSLYDISGSLGESNFILNGHVEHLGYFVDPLKNEGVTATLNMQSSFINLDEIVDFLTRLPADSIADGSSKPTADLFEFNVGLSVDSINFKRFKGANLHATLQVEPKRILIERATSSGMGGKMAISGSISKQFNGDFYIVANAQTKTVELDSLFYVFDNFQQDFITDKYLKGQLNSSIYTYMYFDENWRFRRNLLYAEALLQIKKGELNNFEPMMALAPYLNNQEEKLSKLKFSDLNSHIDIANDTVYLSDMYIGSNVRNIKIGGYHTLNQHIDYRLSVPVINDKRDKDQEFGEVKTDKEGRLYWPFRIRGTTEDYKVTYDLGKAGSNIVKGVKREITELGNTLIGKKKEVKKDTLLLDDDEYFDWDN